MAPSWRFSWLQHLVLKQVVLMIWAAHISPSDNFPTSNLSHVLLQNATNRHARLNSFSTSPQSAKYGVNQFSDLSQREFRGKFLKFWKVCRTGSDTWACSVRWNVFLLIFYICPVSIIPSGWLRWICQHVSLYPGRSLNCICCPQICTCERVPTEFLSSLDWRQRGCRPNLTGETKEWWLQSRTNKQYDLHRLIINTLYCKMKTYCR